MLDDKLFLPSIHPGYARLLAAHARGKGVDLDALFQGNSLAWDDLVKSPSFVSFEQFKRLFIRAQELSGNADLALEISSISQASSHGPLGYGALAAPTLRDTFELVQRMTATRISILNVFLKEDENGVAHFRVEPQFDLAELELFVYMMLLGSFLDFIAQTTGDRETSIVVLLPMARLENEAGYQSKFPQVEFRYQHSALELLLPAELLAQPCLTFDDFAYRNALMECEQLLEQAGQGGAFARRVKTYLFEHRDNLPTEQAAADDFAMSVRTFIRKLKAEKISYQTLLDEVRKELVIWYMSDKTMSIDEVASRIGYVDTSNFSRAFRRWFNQTPSEFRRNI